MEKNKLTLEDWEKFLEETPPQLSNRKPLLKLYSKVAKDAVDKAISDLAKNLKIRKA